MSRSIVVTMLAAAALLGGCTSYGVRHYPPGCPQASAPWPPPAPLPPPPPPRL